jgi:hypothetical protein
MNIFGVVLIDPFMPSERITDFPVFNKYLVEQINLINPQVVFIHAKTGVEKINYDLIDQLNCPIKSYFDFYEEWMKSGLLVGNWLYVGTHFESCVHLNSLGILNMMDIKRFNVNDYAEKFNIFVRSDLLLHSDRFDIDMPEGSCSESDIIDDAYCVWERMKTKEPFFKCLEVRQRPTKENFQPEGNKHSIFQRSYDMSINRSKDKRLT